VTAWNVLYVRWRYDSKVFHTYITIYLLHELINYTWWTTMWYDFSLKLWHIWGAIKNFCNLATNILYHTCCHFWHILMQHQWIFSTFVLSCLCPVNGIFCLDSQTMPSQRSSVIHRLFTKFHEDCTSDFLLGNNYRELSLDCRQDGSVEQIQSRVTLLPFHTALLFSFPKPAFHSSSWQLVRCIQKAD